MLLSIVLILAGISVTAFSYTQHPTYYINSSSKTVIVGNGSAEFYGYSGLPSNLTIKTVNGNATVEVYLVSVYKNALGITQISYTLEGHEIIGFNETTIIRLPVQYFSPEYKVNVTSSNSTNVTLVFSTQIPQKAASNIYIEAIGISMLIFGIVTLVVYITKNKTP